MADSQLKPRLSIVNGRDDRNAARVAEMYAAYSDGRSLADVAGLFGLTRQAVHGLFKSRNLPLRSKQFLPVVEFNGATYSVNPRTGYYRQTNGDRGHLHRHVWEFYNGSIPDGWDVHHRDENKRNNLIANLHCLPKPDHTRHHNPQQQVVAKPCLFCGQTLVRRRFSEKRVEPPAALAKRWFCNTECAHGWLKGKKRGTRVENAQP